MDSTSALASVSPSPSGSSLQKAEPSNRTPAPYGQACIGCTKAKCKCILIPETGRGSGFTCERCNRLGRECKPSKGVRKRGAAGPKRGSAGSGSARGSSGTVVARRATNLEKKLEDLVAILKAQTSPVSALASSQSGCRESYLRQGTMHEDIKAQLGVPAPSLTEQDSNNVVSGIVSGGPSVVTPAASTDVPTGSTTYSAPSPLPAFVQDISMSAAEAEEALEMFRQSHIRFFPFIYIPPGMKAEQLQRDRPYLWLNIVALGCKSPIKQAALNRRSREEMAHKILVSCERNIDILLGLLVHLGWTMHFFISKPTLNAVMNMAMTIVSDLRLDKPSHEHNPKDYICFKTQDFARVVQSTARTIEERRATLACYVFCSSGCAFLRSQSMRWTPHMEDSLKMLAGNPEWEGDEILVLMVRIRRLLDGLSQAQEKAGSECDVYGSLKPSIGIYVRYFRQGLQLIKDRLPESLKDNIIATSLILSAEMCITDLPFYNCICWAQIPDCHPDASTRPNRNREADGHSRYTDPSRIEAVYTNLQASKTVFEHYLTFDLPDLLGISFPILLNFYRAAQILYRLRILDDPGWDRSVVANSVDLLGGIEVVASRLAQIPDLYGFLTETDRQGNEVTNFYVKCSRTFSGTAPMWRANFAQAEGSNTSTGTGASIEANAGGDGGGTGPQGLLPAVMGTTASMNPSLNTRANWANHHGVSNFMMPELFSLEFPMDDAWYGDTWSSWDAGFVGPFQ